MPERIVVDASVVLKWIPAGRETQVAEAREIFRLFQKGSIEIIAPTFLLLEVSNILLKKRKADPLEVSKALKEIITCGIKYLDLRLEMIEDVIEIMRKYNITSYDAIYLFMAKEHKAKLLTFDKELLTIKYLTISIEDYFKKTR